MSAIWLLTTRGRPEACQAVLDACENTGMRSRGLVYVDGTCEQYENLRLPKNWKVKLEPEWGGIAAGMNYCLARYPRATQYGWLADDMFPITEGWDKLLEAAAGDWCVSFCNDDWLAKTEWAIEISNGNFLTAGICWGAKLIQRVGWWALPGVRQGGIDAAWSDIARLLQCGRYLPDVTVEHRTWKNGRREEDETDAHVKFGVNYIEEDVRVYYQWCEHNRQVLVDGLRR